MARSTAQWVTGLAASALLLTACTGEGGDLDVATTAEERALAAEGDPAAGEEVFTQRAEPSCGQCHALSAAGAAGGEATNFDEDQLGGAAVVRGLVGGDIGVHEPDYLQQLSIQEIADVAAYIAQESGGGS